MTTKKRTKKSQTPARPPMTAKEIDALKDVFRRAGIAAAEYQEQLEQFPIKTRTRTRYVRKPTRKAA